MALLEVFGVSLVCSPSSSSSSDSSSPTSSFESVMSSISGPSGSGNLLNKQAVRAGLEKAPTTCGSAEPWMAIGTSLLVGYLRGALEDYKSRGSVLFGLHSWWTALSTSGFEDSSHI
jgi:hypothetical protein